MLQHLIEPLGLGETSKIIKSHCLCQAMPMHCPRSSQQLQGHPWGQNSLQSLWKESWSCSPSPALPQRHFCLLGAVRACLQP